MFLVPQCVHRHLPVLAEVHKRHLLLARDLGGLGGGVNAPLFHGHGAHRVGQKLCQCALCAVAALLGKVAGQAVIERLFVKSRLEVKLADITMLRYILDVGAGRQHQRPRQAKVGEQRLALLSKQRFAIAEQRERHIAQRQPHHAAAGRVGADKAAQAGLGRHNGVPRLPRKFVAAAIAARDRVADAAGGDQRIRCAVCLPPVGDGTLADAVLNQQLFCAAPHKFSVPGIVPQCRQHIGGAVRLRKDPPPALGFKRYTESFKQLHRRRRRECVKAGIEEPPVAPHIG